VSWASKKQNSVALSTVEAEYIVAGHCCAQLLWMRQTLRDYGYNLRKVPLLCDNESAIRMADNPVEHIRTKHIDIRYHFLRDHQQKGDIQIAYVSTKEQLADITNKESPFLAINAKGGEILSPKQKDRTTNFKKFRNEDLFGFHKSLFFNWYLVISNFFN
jgi:hypothetical protein